MEVLCLQSMSCRVVADPPGIFSYRKSHDGEMVVVIMRSWPATSLQGRDCFILGKALDPVTRPCTHRVISRVTSQDVPQSGLAQSIHGRPNAGWLLRLRLGSCAQSSSRCPDIFPSGSVLLPLSVPEGDLEIIFWGNEQLDGQSHEGSCSV